MVLFGGTIHPLSYLFYRNSTILAPIHIIECGVERNGFGVVLWFLARQEVGEFLCQFTHFAQTGAAFLHIVELGKDVGYYRIAAK